MLVGDFEGHFQDFVRGFGGVVLPETDTESADFLFSQDNVVSELKTLEEEARLEHTRKLQALADGWMKRGLLIGFGRFQISLQQLHPICQREWLHILQPPVERVVRKANRQIRATKQSLNLPTAKGLLLIANDGNLLHTSPIDYMNLVARALQKKTPTGDLQFPHIHGVVYFSYRIGSRDEGMPFWVSGDIERNGDAQMRALQEKLRHGWFSYLASKTGLPVSEIIKPVSFGP